MKFTKFIPLVCALALTVPVFAEDPEPAGTGTRSLDHDYTITIPDYFNISEVSSTTTGGVITTNDPDAGSLVMSNTMGATYKIVNNIPNKAFYIKATTTTTGGAKPAFKAAANLTDITIAFANTKANQIPSDEALTNVLGTPSAASNANIIALDFDLGTITGDISQLTVPTSCTAQQLNFVANPGTFTIPFTLGTSAVANTYSSLDASGNYVANIIITESGS